MRVFVQTLAHTETERTPVGAQTVAVLCDCEIHTFIFESALHTTPGGMEGKSYLVCFTAQGDDTLIMENPCRIG